MKKTILNLFLVVSLGMIFTFTNVSAREYYYTNDNGVSLTEEEYEFLSNLYWDGYQEHMTQEQYQKFVEKDLINGEFKSNSVNDIEFITRGTSHTTSSKNIKIARSCTTNCTVVITLTWLANPTIRSYDVIGARFDGVSLLYTPVTQYTDSGTAFYPSNYKTASNGVGNSLKLSSGSDIIIYQEMDVTSGGTVYASYQHATSNTTLAVSKDYSFSISGYGDVFLFSATGRGIYDGMNGVSVDL